MEKIIVNESVNIPWLLKMNRIKKGLNQNELAKLSGVSLTSVTGIESGSWNKIGIDIIVKLSKALDISVDDLVVEKEFVRDA
ncbi:MULTISPECIES: helix-turn-helix domain-containing protein [Clostridium]|uniref:helix-turn-helix domain-containing protein n=1 Tax=Clostridium TaxID=1485 RepID=UPI00232EF7A9|nr:MULTISPECIES: helix-turn-helix transcriptional regulator [Clostridium]MDB2104820.1 helix-turn-helix transcriptional regulator [Clostridium paraputrificum]MDU2108714.1 helix-turn-helix transcriptional regulator [Clostridium sp.]MDU3355175.1 helix-turn-helix transcriptional regulator [Clostridium sp.]MDU4727967.1 helix-turn-helix transcriptional regulator [Clostridium sp.]